MVHRKQGEGDGLSRTARGFRSVGPWVDLTWRFLGAGVVWGVAGFFADKWLGTAPWMLVAGASVGIVVGFIAFWRSYQAMARKDGAGR